LSNNKQQFKLLANNIRKLINESKYKQTEIAAKLQLGDSVISKWIRGERVPTANNLIALSNVLGVGVAEFWYGVGHVSYSPYYYELIKEAKLLDEKQTIAILTVIRSMLPPPGIEELVKKAVKLNNEEIKSLMTLINLKNN